MEELKQSSESLLDEAKKPFNKLMLVIAVIGLIIGIVGIVLYFIGTKERDISYELTEPTSLIFDSNNTSSKIKLLEKDSIPITENVYLLTGKLWNSGDLSITKDDIRKKLSFQLKGAKRILDFKIVKQKDESVANFKLSTESNNLLNIDWSFFDPNYGFVFQILYIGNENPEFKITGVIFGISNYNKVVLSNPFYFYIFLFWFIIVIIISLKQFYSVYNIFKRNSIRKDGLVNKLKTIDNKESPYYKLIQNDIDNISKKVNIKTYGSLIILMCLGLIMLAYVIFEYRTFSI